MQECESTGLQSAANSQAPILYYHAKMKSWVRDLELSLIQPKMQGYNIKVKVKVWMNLFLLWCIINSLLCYATAKADIKLAD